VKELIEVTDGKQLTEVDGLDNKGLSHVMHLFKDMSFEQARQYSSSQDEGNKR